MITMNDNQKMFLAQYGSKEHLDKLVNDKVHWIRSGVASNPNATKKHLDRLVNDDSPVIRAGVAQNLNVTKEHLDKLVNDEDKWVKAISEETLKKLKLMDMLYKTRTITEINFTF